MTVRRRKDLPKLQEQLKAEGVDYDPIYYEDIAYHTGETGKFIKDGVFTGKQMTPSDWEVKTGQASEPITFFGQNVMLSFFRKGSRDVMKLHGMKVVRYDDLPNEFKTPAVSGQKEKQVRDYIDWVKKNHMGDIVPSPQTIVGVTFRGKPSVTTEKEWMVLGDIKDVKWTGITTDPFYKESGNKLIMKVYSNKQFPQKNLINRVWSNIKGFVADTKANKTLVENTYKEITNKLEKNEPLTKREQDFVDVLKEDYVNEILDNPREYEKFEKDVIRQNKRKLMEAKQYINRNNSFKRDFTPNLPSRYEISKIINRPPNIPRDYPHDYPRDYPIDYPRDYPTDYPRDYPIPTTRHPPGVTPPYYPPGEPPEEPPKEPPKEDKKKIKQVKPKGYSIIARHYDRKGHYEDKAVDVGFTLKDAIELGQAYVDENPETSFSVKPSNKEGKRYKGIGRSHKFTLRHGRFYELNQYRNDYPKEKKGMGLKKMKRLMKAI